jgi:protein-disulfide isomerase
VSDEGAGGDEPETQELGSPVGDGSGSGSSGPSPSMFTTPERAIPVSELGYTAGDTAAPLRVVEFSDFGCGYCRQFHLEVYPTIEREYIATGKVQWKYVPMILGIFGPAAELAAHAGECAIEQGGGFPTMRDRIFEEQPEWKGASDPLAVLEGYARDADLDVSRWSRCVQEERRIDRIASGTTLGLRSGVRGTPTFFVLGHGTIPGSLPLSLFRQILDEALATEAEP